MTLSKDEAAAALAAVEEAKGRGRAFRWYSSVAGGLIWWGFIWLLADSILQLAPSIPWIWPLASLVGVIGSLVSGPMFYGSYRSQYQAHGWKVTISFVFVVMFITSLFWVMWPMTGKQGHAFWGIFFGSFYAILGTWVGARIAIVGVLLCALSLIGYFWVDTYFLLFMGVVGGGGMILGGFWLQKA
jgi:hypothetical protein